LAKYIPIEELRLVDIRTPPTNVGEQQEAYFHELYDHRLQYDATSLSWASISDELILRKDLVAKHLVQTITHYGKLYAPLNGAALEKGPEGVGCFGHMVEAAICKELGPWLKKNGVRLNPNSVIFELGAADGTIGWILAQIYGCRVINIENWPERCKNGASVSVAIMQNRAGKVPIQNHRVAMVEGDFTRQMQYVDADLFYSYDSW
jgi:hypothetical protein